MTTVDVSVRIATPPMTLKKYCQRCGDTVSPDNSIGCLNGAVFHRNCLSCKVCDAKLTLVTYYVNKTQPNDNEVYCSKHVPKLAAISRLPPQPTIDKTGSSKGDNKQYRYNFSCQRCRAVNCGRRRRAYRKAQTYAAQNQI